MSRLQLESLFITSSTPKITPRPVSGPAARPKKPTSISAPMLALRPKKLAPKYAKRPKKGTPSPTPRPIITSIP